MSGVGNFLGYAATAAVGFVGGGLAGWFGRPKAQVNADLYRERVEQRRKLIAEGRSLIRDFTEHSYVPGAVASDERFLALRPYLSQSVIDVYEGKTATTVVMSAGGPLVHPQLREDLGRLERKWNVGP